MNLDSGKSIRIRARETSQAQVRDYSPNVTDELEQQLLAYQNLPQDTLFDVQSIEVEVHYSDLSGSTRFKSESVSIGVIVRDKREIYKTTKYCVGFVPEIPTLTGEAVNVSRANSITLIRFKKIRIEEAMGTTSIIIPKSDPVSTRDFHFARYNVSN